MGEAYCELDVATYSISTAPTLDDLEELVAALKSHGDATYTTYEDSDEDPEGNLYRYIEFIVTKRFYEGSLEYAEWLQEKEAAELFRKLAQLRYDQQRQKAEQQKAREQDTEYWNYICHRTDEMKKMEEKHGPCPRWVGYVPTYTKEACGVGGNDE
jgi:hypothetical protein